MNQLSLNPIDRRVIDLSGRRQAASNVRRFEAARANLRAAPANLRAAPAGPLVCHWRRDPATGALHCVWSVSQGAREPASPVPLRRAS
ncbi:MAG TPA: hypothetical protein VEF36_05535 [Roseiarcus sp.]|nr:hypothetical protein [Roseiarcus sp.]